MSIETRVRNTNFPSKSGGGGAGTVTSVSINSANGVFGTVNNSTTTPSLKLFVNDTFAYTYAGGF